MLYERTLVWKLIKDVYWFPTLLQDTVLLKSLICLTLGKNIVHQISVTLEDLYNGATRKLALQKNIICERCEGTCFAVQVIFYMLLLASITGLVK